MKSLSIKQALTAVLVMTMPLATIAQVDPGGAGNPDAVPFSDYANLVFLGIGLVFAGVVFVKNQQKKTAKA